MKSSNLTNTYLKFLSNNELHYKLFTITHKSFDKILDKIESHSDFIEYEYLSELIIDASKNILESYSVIKYTLIKKFTDIHKNGLDYVNDINNNLTNYKNNLSNLEPFNYNLYMQHNLSKSLPKIKNFDSHMKEQLKLFNSPIILDGEQFKNKFNWDAFNKCIEGECRKLFNWKLDENPGLLFLLHKHFFLGAVPDFAKLYLEDILKYIKDSDKIANEFKSFYYELTINLADSLFNKINEIISQIPKTINYINTTVSDFRKNTIIEAYFVAVKEYCANVSYIITVTLLYSIWGKLAYFNKLETIDNLIKIYKK